MANSLPQGSVAMTEKTVLNATHRALGARMVDFGGWDMPINYGSQIEEHHAVRREAGMFDVSHMTVIDLHGARVRDFLRHLLANSVDKLKVQGKALYSCMLDERGGVIDDLIVYYLGDEFYRLVVNAGTRAKDLAWIELQAQAFEVQVKERPEFAMIAVQGPAARAKVLGLLHEVDRARIEKLGKFAAAAAQGPHGMPLFVARTGYTGEDGFEIVVPAEHAVALDEGRAFIGRDALERQKADGVPRVMIGVVLDEKGVLRHGQKVRTAHGDGEILSGSFAPTLNKAIGFARIPAGDPGDLHVDIRGRDVSVRRVKYPFVRDGKPCEGI
jgi:aminomethyltransferase